MTVVNLQLKVYNDQTNYWSHKNLKFRSSLIEVLGF